MAILYHNILPTYESISRIRQVSLVISSFRWMTYLQLAHLWGALLAGSPYRSQEGYEHVTSVRLTDGGSCDIVYECQVVNNTSGPCTSNVDYVINIFLDD